MTAERWLVCDFCPPKGEDGNEWPESAFVGTGAAYRADGRRMCKACWEDRYPRRKVHCASCRRLISTHGSSPQPLCSSCRQGRHGFRMHCIECGSSARFRWISLRTGLCDSCRTVAARRVKGVGGSPPEWEALECDYCTREMRRPPGSDRTMHRLCARNGRVGIVRNNSAA